MAADRPRKRISPGEGYDAGDRSNQTGVRAVLSDRVRLTGQDDKLIVGLWDHTATAKFGTPCDQVAVMVTIEWFVLLSSDNTFLVAVRQLAPAA